jgi:hypothetical protein
VRYGDAACDEQDWSRFAADVEHVQQVADGNTATTAGAKAAAGANS